jgi:hypothetical protein
MKKLQIKFFEIDEITGLPMYRKTIIAGHLDATRNITVISRCEVNIENRKLDIDDLHIPIKIDHFNICEGMVTIYYQDGHFLEISRIYA